jgi:hypothetical protein
VRELEGLMNGDRLGLSFLGAAVCFDKGGGGGGRRRSASRSREDEEDEESLLGDDLRGGGGGGDFMPSPGATDCDADLIEDLEFGDNCT